MSLIKDVLQAVARRISGEYPCECGFQKPDDQTHAVLLAQAGVTIEFRDPLNPEVVVAKVVMREMRRSVSEGTTAEFSDYSRWLVANRLANAATNMAARMDTSVVEVDAADEEYVTPPSVNPGSALDVALKRSHEAQQRFSETGRMQGRRAKNPFVKGD